MAKSDNSIGQEFVGGKWRNIPQDVKEAERMTDWAYDNGLGNSEFGQWAEYHYYRLCSRTDEIRRSDGNAYDFGYFD